MEREASQLDIGRVDEAVPSLAPLVTDAPLEALTEKVTHTYGEGSREALRALHDTLRVLMPTEANGQALLRIIDSGALAPLRSEEGESTRALAIETLLRLGYPWALSLSPEELGWYRDQQSSKRLRARVLLFAITGLSAAAAALAYLQFAGKL